MAAIRSAAIATLRLAGFTATAPGRRWAARNPARPITALNLTLRERPRPRVNGILSFWITYILTRPPGASLGDLMSQPPAGGSLGVGTAMASGLFPDTILALIVCLVMTKTDAGGHADPAHDDNDGLAGPVISQS